MPIDWLPTVAKTLNMAGVKAARLFTKGCCARRLISLSLKAGELPVSVPSVPTRLVSTTRPGCMKLSLAVKRGFTSL